MEVEILVNYGANIEAEDQMGEPSFCRAIFNGDIYTVVVLIARGANPLARLRGALVGLTPLGASKRNKEAMAEAMEKIYNLLKEVEVAWKLLGKKCSKFRLVYSHSILSLRATQNTLAYFKQRLNAADS